MGSTVSVAAPQPTKDAANESFESGTHRKKKREPPPHLSGVKLVEYKCRKKKRAWSNCVGSWYDSRFLSGKALEEEQADCDDLFEKFRECYMRNMLKEREKKGLPPPKGNTMLAECMEEEGIEPKK